MFPWTSEKKTVKSNFILLELILIRIFEAWQLWIEQVNVELAVFRSCELPTSERFCSNKDLTAARDFFFTTFVKVINSLSAITIDPPK